MNQHLIVVAGGTGTRMQAPTAKQFIALEGLPLMWWTLRRFREALGDALPVTLVLYPGLFEEFRALEAQYGPAGIDQLVPGGAERFHSVRAGLAALPDSGVVGIHDAVRPFPDVSVIRTCFEVASTAGGAIPVVPVKDSIRDLAMGPLDRACLPAVQTPQCFDLARIKPAYAMAYEDRFTDDASVYEAAGHTVELVPGNARNIKVTTPEDLVVARAFLRAEGDQLTSLT